MQLIPAAAGREAVCSKVQERFVYHARGRKPGGRVNSQVDTSSREQSRRTERRVFHVRSRWLLEAPHGQVVSPLGRIIDILSKSNYTPSIDNVLAIQFFTKLGHFLNVTPHVICNLSRDQLIRGSGRPDSAYDLYFLFGVTGILPYCEDAQLCLISGQNVKNVPATWS